METPTITKKQAKNTLSGKKRKTEVIKNVLVKPYESFWPLLNSENTKYLTETLEKFLPRLIPNKVNVPYDKIKNIPKAERKKFRESLNKEDFQISESDRKNLIFGVNDVSKLIENGDAGSILVSNQVQPRLLVQHIVDEAVLHNVPILVVNNLKDICKKKCGVAGAVLSLRKSVSGDSELGVIQQAIVNLCENYPSPKNHVHYQRRLNLSVISIPDSDDGKIVISDDEQVVKNYYLMRQGEKRAFIPEKSGEKVTAFINLDSFCESPEKVEINDVPLRYHSLRVKRVRGDKNRSKRKIKSFKGKKK